MDPMTIAMLGMSVIGGLQKAEQAKRQGIIDVARAKWSGFNQNLNPTQAGPGTSLLGDLAGGLANSLRAGQENPELMAKGNEYLQSGWDKLFGASKPAKKEELADLGLEQADKYARASRYGRTV